jgi:glycosyltransferase involved in cell wall biosynthesis
MATVIQNYNDYIENLRYITSWKPTNIINRIFIAFSAYIKIFSLLLFDKRIKIVHIHGAAYGSFYRKKIIIKLAKQFRKKTIYHMHGGEFKDFFEKSNNKKEILKTINSCDICIVLSNSWKKYFESIGVISQRIHILNNSIHRPNIDKYIPTKLDSDILNILFLGTLVKEKGIFDLLDVLIEDKKYFNKRIRLVIGGIKNENIITEIIRKEELNSFVEFKGWISKEDKEREYYNADLLVLPSYFEALPMVILEAMSFNCAILSTNVGGIPDVVAHTINGELINPGDKKAIKDALIKFINNRELVRKYQNSSIETIKSFYPDTVFSDLEIIYKNLLS